MEIMHLLYRNPETGKVWEHIGGQEPRELSDEEVKFRRLDVNTIPFAERGEKKKVICSNCGSAVELTPFCPVCGAKLETPDGGR